MGGSQVCTISLIKPKCSPTFFSEKKMHIDTFFREGYNLPSVHIYLFECVFIPVFDYKFQDHCLSYFSVTVLKFPKKSKSGECTFAYNSIGMVSIIAEMIWQQSGLQGGKIRKLTDDVVLESRQNKGKALPSPRTVNTLPPARLHPSTFHYFFLRNNHLNT